MPLIEIHLARGRTEEQKRALMQAITDAVQESIRAPLASIRVWIHEFAPEEFMVGGEVLADREQRVEDHS